MMGDTMMMKRALKRIAAGLKTTRVCLVLGAVIVSGLIAAYLLVKATGVLEAACDCQTLHDYIIHFGVSGPVVVIGFMAAAIVVNPIPSAPIAIAAGLVYGHLWRTLYIVSGAELGAFGDLCDWQDGRARRLIPMVWRAIVYGIIRLAMELDVNRVVRTAAPFHLL